ncbi:hypothetical protein [Enterococcus phage vB_EfKS5]|nr:hypothetical protein [Enterococcus phage vB_EfKS5]
MSEADWERGSNPLLAPYILPEKHFGQRLEVYLGGLVKGTLNNPLL